MIAHFDSLMGNRLRLDGGSMFGNAPRALWERWAPADEDHRIDMSCRSLLMRETRRNVLFEAGIGAFFAPNMRDRYGVVESGHALLDQLQRFGMGHEDVEVVVLSHLHFDHAGGLLAAYEEGAPPALLFPNATFVVGKEAFARAQQPHPRDRASFIPQLPGLLQATGRLELVDGEFSSTLGDRVRFRRSDGHTPGMLVPEIESDEGPLAFVADLAPGKAWVHAPITMGYDRFPERLIEEKQALFEELVERKGRLFFTHDPECAVARLDRDDRGRFVALDDVRELRS